MWKPYAKALIAGLLAAIAFAIPIANDGLSLSELLGMIAVLLTTGSAVAFTPWMPAAKVTSGTTPVTRVNP
jgi:hypothetical protein